MLVGILAGFVISSAIGVFVQDSGLFGASGESPVTRRYVLGMLQSDPNSTISIREPGTIAKRAAELQGADVNRSSASMQPLSLTYLGGASAGSYSVHIYAVIFQTPQGNQFWPWAITVQGGKVIRSE